MIIFETGIAFDTFVSGIKPTLAPPSSTVTYTAVTGVGTAAEVYTVNQGGSLIGSGIMASLNGHNELVFVIGTGPSISQLEQFANQLLLAAP
jgi:hypothetical protein